MKAQNQGGSVTIHFTITGKKTPLVYSDPIFLTTKVQKKTIQQVDGEQPVMSQYMYITDLVNTVASRGDRGEEA